MLTKDSILPQESKELQISSYIGNEWFSILADDIKVIITEAVHNSRWDLVSGYWQVGERIEQEIRTRPINKIQLFQDLGETISKGNSTLYYAHKAFIKYPDINTLPEGKNISWNKLITKYLPDPRKEIDITGIILPENVEIKNEDFRESDLLENSVDCIITDPPYPVEFIDLWNDLGIFANKVLKPSGFLVAYSGEINLPAVIERLSKHLTYYWTFCLYHEGKTQLIMPRNIICRWKPILIYQKPPFKKLETVIQDYVISEQPEKGDHEWQQSESGVKDLIEKFTKPGDIVVDPFSGAGTFAKVAHEMKRKAVGYEIDELAFNSSIKRINDTTRTNQ
jgi:hypothetical protein